MYVFILYVIHMKIAEQIVVKNPNLGLNWCSKVKIIARGKASSYDKITID